MLPHGCLSRQRQDFIIFYHTLLTTLFVLICSIEDLIFEVLLFLSRRGTRRYNTHRLCACLHPSSFASTGSRYRILGLCAGWLTLIFRVRLPRESFIPRELTKTEFLSFPLHYGKVSGHEVLTTIPLVEHRGNDPRWFSACKADDHSMQSHAP